MKYNQPVAVTDNLVAVVHQTSAVGPEAPVRNDKEPIDVTATVCILNHMHFQPLTVPSGIWRCQNCSQRHPGRREECVGYSIYSWSRRNRW